MAGFIFLMHDDALDGGNHDWPAYLNGLRASGRFEGGSEIGGGACYRKSSPSREIAGHIGGYIKVEARDLAEAATLLVGNPVYENGGTVEIRELPES
jgi:hypothetical protein